VDDPGLAIPGVLSMVDLGPLIPLLRAGPGPSFPAGHPGLPIPIVSPVTTDSGLAVSGVRR